MRKPQKTNDKTFTKGVPTGRLRDSELKARGPAGTYGAVVPPSQEAARRAIAAQTCPFCGRGPFRMLPVHTNKAHGVDKYELRDMAGLMVRDALCSEEALSAMRDNAHPENREKAKGGPRTKKYRYTKAGRAKQVKSLKTWEKENPEAARRARSANAKKRWHPPAASAGVTPA